MPVAAQVLRHALERPHRPAVCGPRTTLTYAELARRIGGAARHLAGRGAARGVVAAISLADPVEQLVAALAAGLAGATPLLCDHGRDPVRRAGMTDAVPVGLWIDAPPPAAPGPPVWTSAQPAGHAWACLSSGSTGRPRVVIRTGESWTASFPHLSDLAGIGPDDVVLIPGPLVSSLYAFAAVHTLATGATALVPGRWSPESLPGHLRRATAVHLVPHHLPTLLETLGESGGPLRTAIVGGAALPPESRSSAARAGVQVVAYYGATELSFVAADPDGSGLRPFPGVEVEVRPPPGPEPAGGPGRVAGQGPWPEPAGGPGHEAGPERGPGRGPGLEWTAGRGSEPVRGPWPEPAGGPGHEAGPGPEPEPGQEPSAGSGQEAGRGLGEVWARSPWLAEGYLGGAAGPLRVDRDGWMTVGDLAEPYRAGEALRLRGRGDGTIQTGGATVLAEDVEEVLKTVPGVGDVVVVGSPHPRLGAVVAAILEANGTVPPSRAVLEAVVRGGLDAAQRPRRWYAVAALPRTPTGKPARGLVAARLAVGDPGIRRLV